MRKLKHVMAGAALMIMFGLTLNSNVKAEITYDLNGNRVDVSSWTKQTSMKDGSYKIISSESGTIAYFDKEGNLLKVENKATGQIIVNNIKESETTTVKKTDETVTVKDRVTMPKVKKLKKTVKHSYYKGVKSIKKNGKPNMGKIKYDYGIKLTWSKVKNAKGYEVYRYENAKGCWTKIKTVKKTTYTLTNMLEGEKVKIRVRAYKKTKSGNEYGKYSGVLSFKTKDMYTKIYKNAKTKGFISKFGSEDAFVYQNKLRKKEGANPLKWNDILYTIAVQRTKDKESTPHEKTDRTRFNILQSLTSESRARELDDTLNLLVGENMVYGGKCSIEKPADVWYETKFYEKGYSHYHNMVSKSYQLGAIAIATKKGDSSGVTSGIYGSDDWNNITK